MSKDEKNTCEIVEMQAKDIRISLSKLLRLANICYEQDCEIVIMKNQITILPKREV